MRILTPLPPAAGNEGADADEASDNEPHANALTTHHGDDDDDDDQYREEKPPSPPPPRPPPSGSGYAAPRPRPAGFAVGGRTRNGPNVRAVGGGR